MGIKVLENMIFIVRKKNHLTFCLANTNMFILKDFCDDTAIENWTCIKMVEYYRSTSKLKNRNRILDCARKDLEQVAISDSNFDMARKKKAQDILDNWKV